MKIAVLLATFNRKEKTLACLESLFSQKLPDGASLEVFLTDDASADGTPDAVKEKYPAIRVLKGSGSLFWAGGMRNSWKEAIKLNPDYYLLLNDDTLLSDGALMRQLDYYTLPALYKGMAICVGSTMDSGTEKISYGGQKLVKRYKEQCVNVYNDNEYIECDMANANVMLVPREVVEKIGALSEVYTHSIADFDYTLRAGKAGFKTIVAPGFAGTCTDDHGKPWRSSNEPLSARVKYLKSPKGLAYHEYLQFVKMHFPLNLPAAFIKLWMKTLFPFMWEKYKKTSINVSTWKR